MLTRVTEDYALYTKQLPIDNEIVRNSVFALRDIVVREFGATTPTYTGTATLTTRLFSTYNALMYPLDGFHELYEEIRIMFKSVLALNDRFERDFYMHSWVNIYEAGEFIEWHRHWRPETNSWHGFYCVDCEPSKTTYLINANTIDVESHNGLLVLGESQDDRHRTWPWGDTTKPRITIAFDIVPRHHVDPNYPLNHWIPV